jgi:hypothetical protein
MRLAAGQTVLFEKLSETELRLIVLRPNKVTPDPRHALSFANRHGLVGGTTEQWLQELREGELD